VRNLILAHDLGTTGNKASLFDPSGALVASTFCAYSTRYPRPGWAEQDPADWWRAIVLSTRRLLADAPRGADAVAVVSFSGQMMGCVPVDDQGRPLCAALIWADQRAEDEASLIATRVGSDAVYAIRAIAPVPATRRPRCSGCGPISQRYSRPRTGCCKPRTMWHSGIRA
jgi:xylulokinase